MPNPMMFGTSDRPQPGDGFEWVQARGGLALVCRPLASLASHFFTTRGWRLGVRVPGGDDDAWAEVAAGLDVDPERLVRVRQVHGRAVFVISDGMGVPTRHDADIIVSHRSDLGLAVQVADCVPVLIADRRTGAVAAAHAGWRGMAAGVPSTVVNAMGRGELAITGSATPWKGTPPTVPSAPTALSAVAGDGQVTASWAAPESTGGTPIKGYTVTATPGGDTCETKSALTCVVRDLVNGTDYTLTVTATNAVGTGAASEPSATVTPATVPSAPTGLAADPGDGQVTVSWAAPATGGSPITGYTVTATPGGRTCVTSAALTCGWRATTAAARSISGVRIATVMAGVNPYVVRAA